jgi:hypothetical protein
MTINGKRFLDGRNSLTSVPLVTFDVPMDNGLILTKKVAINYIMKDEYVIELLKEGNLRGEYIGDSHYRGIISKSLGRFRFIDPCSQIINIKALYWVGDKLFGDIDLLYPLDNDINDYKTAIRFYNVRTKTGTNGILKSFSFVTFDLVPIKQGKTYQEQEPKQDNSPDELSLGLKECDSETGAMMCDLITRSRLPSPGSSVEITSIEKAEEEAMELLSSLRFLKNHYSPVKSTRKGYSEETRLHAVKDIVEEIGDVIVDAAYVLSTIIPDIRLSDINNRVDKKIDKYKDVIKNINEIALNV